MLVLCLYMKITTCLLVLINQSRTESYEFSSLSAHDSSQREIQKTGISYMITMGWTHLLILSCVTQLPSIWCSCSIWGGSTYYTSWPRSTQTTMTHSPMCWPWQCVWVAPDKIWVIASCWPNHRWITWNFSMCFNIF